ncbi:MAG: hypothetical protein AB7C91_06665 [Sphaerochaeta sp.]|jgi:hypothetical protein
MKKASTNDSLIRKLCLVDAFVLPVIFAYLTEVGQVCHEVEEYLVGK